MAISKKEARKVAAVLKEHLGPGATDDMILTLLEAKVIKNKGFRKSLKRISNALEGPKRVKTKKAA